MGFSLCVCVVFLGGELHETACEFALDTVFGFGEGLQLLLSGVAWEVSFFLFLSCFLAK